MTGEHFVVGWDTISELVEWCGLHVGNLIWTNGITDWIGYGWAINRVSGGFQVKIDDPQKYTLTLLKWT